jgi:hypothetical protein
MQTSMLLCSSSMTYLRCWITPLSTMRAWFSVDSVCIGVYTCISVLVYKYISVLVNKGVVVWGFLGLLGFLGL